MSSAIDYEKLMSFAQARDADSVTAFLLEELPHAWDERYRSCCSHKPNLLRISTSGFEYIFDFVQESVARGDVTPAEAVEDRVIGVHGRSALAADKRKDQLMRGRPLGPVDVMPEEKRSDYDKGHFIAHSMGGGLEINIFPQIRSLNRGWSDRGKVFRAMERYCQDHPRTYCFCHPIYAGCSWHPARIEFGVLRRDGTLWVETFENAGSREELAEMERLLRPELLRWYGKAP